MKTFLNTKTLVILAAVFMMALAYTANAAQVLEYRFEDQSPNRATDTSGQANHGTPLRAQNVRPSTNGNTLSTQSSPVRGQMRYALSLPGHGFAALLNGKDEFINAGNRPDFNLSTYTLMAWFRLKADPYLDEVAEKGAAYWLNIQPGSHKVRGGGFYGGCDPALNFDNTDGAVPVAFGEWTHAASTYDGLLLKIYVNGQLVGEKQPKVTGPVCTNTRPLAIGAKYVPAGLPRAVNGNFLGGRIDDVRLYKNEVLTSAQIQEAMLQP